MKMFCMVNVMLVGLAMMYRRSVENGSSLYIGGEALIYILFGLYKICIRVLEKEEPSSNLQKETDDRTYGKLSSEPSVMADGKLASLHASLEDRDKMGTTHQFSLLTLLHIVLAYLILSGHSHSKTFESHTKTVEAQIKTGFILWFVSSLTAITATTHSTQSYKHIASVRVYKVYYAMKIFCMVNIVLFVLAVEYNKCVTTSGKVYIGLMALLYVSWAVYKICIRIFKKEPSSDLQTELMA